MSDEKKRKTIRFSFRIDEDLAEHLAEKAEEMGLSMSEYLRCLAESKPMVRLETEKNLQHIKYELSMIGNNLNQIAREFNSSLFLCMDKTDSERLRNSLIELNRVLSKIYQTV